MTSVAAGRVDFYFDFKSPYSYLAFGRFGEIAARHGRPTSYRAVDLPQLKRRAGNTGPTTREMPMRLRYARTDMQRWAARCGIPLVPPRGVASERLNRGTFYAEQRGAGLAYMRWVWARTWGEGADMDGDAMLSRAALALGWDPHAFVAFVDSEEAIDAYEQATADASALGVFGVPTMLADGAMWWGNDRLDLLDEHLSGTSHRSSA